MAKRRKLPPDPEGQNNDRASWALVAVNLVCDLRRLCDRKGVSWSWVIERADSHYAEEVYADDLDARALAIGNAVLGIHAGKAGAR